MKVNVPITGFVIGLFAPFIGLFIMYFLWGEHQGLGSFVRSLFILHDLGGKVFTLSLLANLGPFLYCNFKRLDYTLKGIVVATVLYGVFIVLLKFNFFR